MRHVRSLIGGFVNKAPTYVQSVGGGRLGAALTTVGNASSQLKGMESGGTLFSVVDALATATAQANWGLWRTAKSGKPEDRTPVTAHAALDVWNHPNPFFTQSELVETIAQHYELTGEGWMVVSRDARATLPLELWPVRPDRMTPLPHRDKFLAGYEYRVGSETVPLGLDEVIFLRRPNPMDPYRGLGPVQAVLADIDANRYSAEWNRNFFLNSAEPGGIIEVPEELTDDEFTRMRTRWAEQHQGVAQAHRVALLEKAKWVDRKYTQRDMQFAELRGLSREIIREAFRVSKTMLGLSEDVNRATAQAAEYVFGKWLIVARLERIKQALNYEFLPLFGATANGIEFDYESPVDDDADAENSARDSKVKAYVLLTGAGVTPESAAQTVGLPEMDHPAKPAPVVQVAPGAPAAQGAAGAPGPTEPGSEPPAGPTDTFSTLTAALTTPCPNPIQAALDDLHAQITAAAAPLPEPPEGIPARLPDGAGPDLAPVQLSWEASLSVVLAEWIRLEAGQRADILRQLRDVVEAGDVTGLRGIEVLHDEGAVVLLNAMTALAETAATQVVAEAAAQDVEISAGLVTRAALAQWADAAAGTLADGMLLSAVREALRVWGPTSTPEQVAGQVQEHLEGLTDAQNRYVLGGALTQAQHTGREATILAGPSAALYADEILDRATCGPCRSVNRRWLGNSDDPAKPWQGQYPVRGYIACEGRDRCRGQVIAVWRGGKDWRQWIEPSEQRGDGR